MKIRTLRNRVAIAVAIGAILTGSAPIESLIYSAVPEVTAAENLGNSDLSDGRGTVTMRKMIADPQAIYGKRAKAALQEPTGAVVTEWNQHAVALALLPASNLAPIQQGRVMAIVQVAVHDAVNGITGKYATYLPAAPVPANA